MVQSDISSQEVLRDEILSDARRQAERAVRKAEREGRAATEKAKDEVQRERDDKLASARELAERKRRLTLATVPVEVARMRAADIERMLLSLRELARGKLAARQGFDYGQTLAKLTTDAIACMEGETFVLELPAADREAYGAALVGKVQDRAGRPGVKLTIAPQPANVADGVVIRDSEGRQVWDNSLAARLDRMWPLLRSQLAKQLGLQTGTEPSGGQS